MKRFAAIRRCAVFAVVAVLAVSLSACGTDDGGDGSSDRLRVMKASRSLSTLPLLYTLENGYLKDEGLDVTSLPDANTNTAPIQALLAGQVDLVQVGATAVFGAQAAGQDVISVGIPSPGPSYQLVLGKDVASNLAGNGTNADAPIAARVQALKGLTFATPGPGSTIDSLLRATLSEYGLKADRDVTIRSIPDPTAMVAALRQGQVDGFSFAPPFTSTSVSDGTAVMWINWASGDVPKFTKMPAGALVTTKSFAAEHGAAITKFMKALSRSYEDLAQDPQRVEALMIKTEYFKDTDPTQFKAGFETYLAAYRLGPIPTHDGFAALRDVYNGDPSIQTKSAAEFDDIFDLSYLEDVS